MTFRRGVAGLAAAEEERKARGSGGPFEAGLLPLSEKERLCRELLAEFGVTHLRPGGHGELIHGCTLPFGNHKDQARNPTASLNYEKLTYNCLGCGAGGGLLWFIGLMRDSSGTEARKWLDQQTGLGADEQSLSSLMSYFDAVYDTTRQQRPPMPRMDAKVLERWLVIHPYMTDPPPGGRGVPEQTLMDHLVGYGTLRVRVGEDQVVESERIVIPHFWKGDLVGWQSRRLSSSDGTPKYVSSPDFPKDESLYGYDPTAPEVVVVESPMSVLSKAHLGHHMEATFGAPATERQAKLLSIHRKVVLWMDNDEAGWLATERLAEALEAYSSVWVVPSPYAADPADFDDQTYADLLAAAEPYAFWTRPRELTEWKRP